MGSPEKFLQQAGDALGADRFTDALGILDQALEQFPQHADAHVLKGIALAELGRNEEATDSFKRAINLAPSRFKAYYNFATHLYQTGAMAEAEDMATKALELNPTHADTRDLLALIRNETPAPRPDLSGRPYGEGEFKVTSYRMGEQFKPEHTIPWIARMGKAWPAIGWLLAAISACTMVFFIKLGADYISSPNISNATSFTNQLMTGPQYTAAIVVALIGFIATSVWSVLDLMDRSSREFVWVLLLCLTSIPVCVVTGLQWVTLPLYLLFGRRA
ncbi:MAG: tetratricopeptide repeat protein [Chthonomonas sp.]|nr:tetratricopeptide repeat protein [Chthonomonas sp.]